VTRAGLASWAPASAHIAKAIAKPTTAPINAAAGPAVRRAMVFIW